MIQEKSETKQLKQNMVAQSSSQLCFKKLITKILYSSSLNNYHISRNTQLYANVQSKFIVDFGNTEVRVYCTSRGGKQNIAKILEVSEMNNKMNTSSIQRYSSDERTTKLTSKFHQYKRKKYQNTQKNKKFHIQQTHYSRYQSTIQTTSTIRQNKSFAYIYLVSNFTISQPFQSQYFIIYALSYRNLGQCKISLITYNKLQNNFKDQCNLLTLKDQHKNKTYIVTIKWLNLNAFICGTNNGYLILCQPQKILKYRLNTINKFIPDEKDEFSIKNNGKGFEIQKISIAPITQIDIITKLKSPQNQSKRISNQYSCIQLQKFAVLTKHEQVFICGFYQINHRQNPIRLCIQVLHRFCCMNASLLIQLHSINDDLMSQNIKQTHLLSSIVKDNQLILTQGTSSGVIKTWKVPKNRICGTIQCQKIHTVSQCIEQYINTKLGKQQIKAQQIEKDEKQLQQKDQKSKQKQFRENLQKSIKHNTIVMIDDMVVQGYLPSSLLNNMSYLQHNESTLNYIQNISNTSIYNYVSDNAMQPQQTRVQNFLKDIISQEKSAALTENYPKINDKTGLQESSEHSSILCRQKIQPLCKLEAVNLINRQISQANNQNNIGNQNNIYQKFIDIQSEPNNNYQPQITINRQNKRKFDVNGVQKCENIKYLQNKQRENKNLSQNFKGHQNYDLFQQNINRNLFPQNMNKKQENTQLTQIILPHFPCKHSIIPLSIISSLFINTTLLQLYYYGHLLVCITSDGYLSIVAMDVPTKPSFQSIHNYEVLMVYRIFKCRKQYGSKNFYEEQQYQEYVNLQIIGTQFYIIVNKMYYSHSGKTSYLIQSYIKKLKFDDYLGIKQVQITILTMPHMNKQQDSSVQQLFNTQIQKIHLLNPKSVIKCKNKVHLNCQQNCQMSLYGLFVKNQKGIYVFNNVIVRSHGLFNQYNSQNQQADFQKYKINKMKIQMDMRQIGVKYI